MTVQERYEGFQTLAKVVNTDGCHFLVLCSIAEEYLGKNVDLLDAIRVSQRMKWIDEEFNVYEKGIPLLEYLTGRKWKRRKVTILPGVILANEYTEAHWVSANNPVGHFRRRYFDTLEFSRTVAEGHIDYYYIYTVE